MATEAGRNDHLDVCCGPFSQQFHDRELHLPAIRDESYQLAEAGVTWLTVFLPGTDRKAFLQNLSRFGREVIDAISCLADGDGDSSSISRTAEARTAAQLARPDESCPQEPRTF
jgi:hypothetical protein